MGLGINSLFPIKNHESTTSNEVHRNPNKINRTVSTISPDITFINDTKTFDELLSSLQSNVNMEFFFDIGTNPIIINNNDYDDTLFAVESFKVKII